MTYLVVRLWNRGWNRRSKSKKRRRRSSRRRACWVVERMYIPLDCLVNQLTCSQRSLCKCIVAPSQSDPQTGLSPGGKWCPWYVVSGKMLRQTGRLYVNPASFSFCAFLPCPVLQRSPGSKITQYSTSGRASSCPDTQSLPAITHTQTNTNL